MTWKQFKEWVEANGAEDGDEIEYIDFCDSPKEFRRDKEGGSFNIY